MDQFLKKHKLSQLIPYEILFKWHVTIKKVESIILKTPKKENFQSQRVSLKNSTKPLEKN